AGGWNSVSAIRAEHVFRTQIDVRSDPQDLAHQRIEPLRERVRGSGRFSSRAVANRNVEIAVVSIPGPSQSVKDQVRNGVIAIVAGPQNFARRSLKRGIANIRVRPLHEYGFKVRGAGRRIHHWSR